MAQRELYDRFSYMMKGVCLRYSANQADAEDLLQESFIRAFKNLNQYNDTGSLGAWLRKITVNVALETYRKNKIAQIHLKAFSFSEKEDIQLDNALLDLHLEDLLKIIQKLPDGYRTVFNLFAIEGFNHEEIGKLLSISIGTTKSQYSRARTMLQKFVKEADQIQNYKKLYYAKG